MTSPTPAVVARRQDQRQHRPGVGQRDQHRRPRREPAPGQRERPGHRQQQNDADDHGRLRLHPDRQRQAGLGQHRDHGERDDPGQQPGSAERETGGGCPGSGGVTGRTADSAVDPICDFLRGREITAGKNCPRLTSLSRGSAIPAYPRWHGHLSVNEHNPAILFPPRRGIIPRARSAAPPRARPAAAQDTEWPQS